MKLLNTNKETQNLLHQCTRNTQLKCYHIYTAFKGAKEEILVPVENKKLDRISSSDKDGIINYVMNENTIKIRM